MWRITCYARKWHIGHVFHTGFIPDEDQSRCELLALDCYFTGVVNQDIILGIRSYLCYYTDLFCDGGSDLCLTLGFYFYRINVFGVWYRLWNVQSDEKHYGTCGWYAFNPILRGTHDFIKKAT